MSPIARNPGNIAPPIGEGLSRHGSPAMPAFRAPSLVFGVSFAAAAGGLLLVVGDLRGADPHNLLAAAVLMLLAMPLIALAERVRGRQPTGTATLRALRGTAAASLADPDKGLLDEAPRNLLARVRQFGVHRTDYVSMVSHELKTPLTSIKGFAQLLLKGDLSPTVAGGYAGMIVKEADRLTLIVNDIVDLTRMETGLLALRCEPMRPAGLIRSVVAALQPAGSPPPLRLRLPENLPAVRGDPKSLQQVLRWLITDAVARASAGAGIVLAAERGEEGVTIRLEYRASSDRIDSLIRALEGPVQGCADDQATRLGRGRLVLYISKNFIEAHGGRMWVDRPREQVVALSFTLPS